MKRAMTLLALTLVACGAEDLQDEALETQPAETAEHTQPLLGDAKYLSTCNQAQRTFLDDVRFYGRVAAASDAFADCVDETMRNGLNGNGPYLTCTKDPYEKSDLDTRIARVLRVARSPNDLSIGCSGGAGLASAHIGTHGHSHDEAFSFSGWLMGVVSNLQGAGQPFPWPYNQAADIVWHEVMHTHGYGHGHNDDNTKAAKACGHEGDPSFHFQQDTIPYIVGACINQVIVRSDSVCNEGLLASRCSGGARQLVKGMSGNACECVHDPSVEHGITLLTGEGADALDTTLTIEAGVPATAQWTPDDPVAFGGGDFNGDGRADVLLREGDGSGALVMAGHDGSGGVVRIAHQAVGQWMGDWHLGTDDVVVGIANMDGWLDDEVVIRSGWGLGVIGNYNGWQSYAMHPYGTDLGAGWILDAADEVVALADLDGDGRGELLLQADDGTLGVAKLFASDLVVVERADNGSWLGTWHIGVNDRVLGAADFDNDGADDYLVRSGWGLGVVGMSNGGLTSKATWKNDSWNGGWYLWASDEVAGVGDFDGDGRAEFVLRDATRTALMETTPQGGFTITASAEHGDRIDNEWVLNRDDTVVGLADLYGSGRDALMIRSGWGLGVIEHDGVQLTVRFLTPFSTLAGAWLLEDTDDFHGRSRAQAAGRQALVLSR